jgi:UDP-2,3-diacylglucosamine hydrolase
MPTTLFVSDLHLDPSRPAATALFERFLAGEARHARALYILGDLFEAWIGDDDPSETAARVADALSATAASGVDIAFMHGNRDFLLGVGYARRAGMRLLDDPAVVEVDGHRVLLMHGDTLCTGDTAYQAFRAQTRDPAWQAAFLAQPLAARQAFARQARTASSARQGELRDQGTMETITDVAPGAVADAFRAHDVDLLVHGHTHRPAVHALEVDGRARTRVVLGDWYEQGSVLRLDRDGPVLARLAR